MITAQTVPNIRTKYDRESSIRLCSVRGCINIKKKLRKFINNSRLTNISLKKIREEATNSLYYFFFIFCLMYSLVVYFTLGIKKVAPPTGSQARNIIIKENREYCCILL